MKYSKFTVIYKNLYQYGHKAKPVILKQVLSMVLIPSPTLTKADCYRNLISQTLKGAGKTGWYV
jgi:hypothetical protein